MIKKLFLTISLFVTSFFTSQVYAVEVVTNKSEFSTSYDVLYDIDEEGITTVTEKVNLKNLTSEYYANQFKLTIGVPSVLDIKAQDPSGALNVSSEQKGTSTVINVKFNQQVAGRGKVLPWTISFKSKDFASKIGKVWEVKAPRIVSTTNLENYNLTIAVPQSFGPPSAISPLPKSQTSSQGKIFLTYDLSQLKLQGVSANFGANQLFDFSLTYHLENNNLMPMLTNIALPPDTPFQDVIYQRIEPKPLNVTLDNDGNYLAWYRLNRNQKIGVSVIGSAKLYSNSKVVSPRLDESLRKKYTAVDKYWEKNNPQIINKLDEIFGNNPPETNEAKAKLVFEFVVNFLKYDPNRLKENSDRMGAVTALNNPEKALCMEFTDLFIALARAANIPARELNGYAYTNNSNLRPSSLAKDILHSWPEYWDDKKGWVMVDPTWENTTNGMDYFSKLDLNHFVFVIKGSSSETPIPAGSYRNQNSSDQDVKVTLANVDFLGHPQIDVAIDTSSFVFSGFPATAKVKITNTGNAFYPAAPLSLVANKLIVLNNDGQNTGIIPAFGSSEFNFQIRTPSLLDSYQDQIILFMGGQKFAKEITLKPLMLFQSTSLVIGIILAVMVVVYFTVLGGHFYRKKGQKKLKAEKKT